MGEGKGARYFPHALRLNVFRMAIGLTSTEFRMRLRKKFDFGSMSSTAIWLSFSFSYSLSAGRLRVWHLTEFLLFLFTFSRNTT